MDKGRVGEESKGKEMDGCPLTERLNYIIEKSGSSMDFLGQFFRIGALSSSLSSLVHTGN
jgi:hypothetical protein